MTVPHVRLRRAMAALTLALGPTVVSHASLFVVHAAAPQLSAAGSEEDGTLAQAKSLYASASYDEALAILERLTPASKDEKAAVGEYRIFCLLALGRQDDANHAIEGMLRDDPFYRPSDARTSPRIQATISEVRRRVLPAIVLSSYADAKAAFDRKDPAAAQQFDRVLTLLDDPDTKGVATLSDLRTVVAGFRDLSAAAVTAPPAPAVQESGAAAAQPVAPLRAPAGTNSPAASSGSGGSLAASTAAGTRSAGDARAAAPSGAARAASPSPAAPVIPPAKAVYDVSDFDVVAPIVVTQRLPPFTQRPTFTTSDLKGVLQITIDTDGNVTSASMRKPVHPLYDSELVRFARQWKFKPATKQGEPVAYVKLIDIVLRPTQSPD